MFLVKAEFKVHKVARKRNGRGTTQLRAAKPGGAAQHVGQGTGLHPAQGTHGDGASVAQPSASRAQPASAGSFSLFQIREGDCVRDPSWSLLPSGPALAPHQDGQAGPHPGLG